MRTNVDRMDLRRPNRLEVVEGVCVRRNPTVAVFALPSGERIKASIDVARDLRTNDRVALSRDWSEGGRIVHASRLHDGRGPNKSMTAPEAKAIR